MRNAKQPHLIRPILSCSFYDERNNSLPHGGEHEEEVMIKCQKAASRNQKESYLIS